MRPYFDQSDHRKQIVNQKLLDIHWVMLELASWWPSLYISKTEIDVKPTYPKKITRKNISDVPFPPKNIDIVSI